MSNIKGCLAIFGAGGHGKVVADAALAAGLWQNVHFYDDSYPQKQQHGNFQIAGTGSDFLALPADTDLFVAIGDNTSRLALCAELMASGKRLATIVHPRAVMASDCVVGPGSLVCAGAVINSCARVGVAAIINTNAVVEHDCCLSDGVHISPGACLGGSVTVKECSWVGIGACVKQGTAIGSACIVGAGAAVVSDVQDNVTVVGVPARPIK